LKLRYLLILFGILVPVAIVARVFQLTGTDPTTGFFKAEAVAANNAIMTGFLGVSLLLVVLGRISKSYPKRIHSPSVPMAAASFVMSAGVFTYFGVTLFTLTSIPSPFFHHPYRISCFSGSSAAWNHLCPVQRDIFYCRKSH